MNFGSARIVRSLFQCIREKRDELQFEHFGEWNLLVNHCQSPAYPCIHQLRGMVESYKNVGLMLFPDQITLLRVIWCL